MQSFKWLSIPGSTLQLFGCCGVSPLSLFLWRMAAFELRPWKELKNVSIISLHSGCSLTVSKCQYWYFVYYLHNCSLGRVFYLKPVNVSSAYLTGGGIIGGKKKIKSLLCGSLCKRPALIKTAGTQTKLNCGQWAPYFSVEVTNDWRLVKFFTRVREKELSEYWKVVNVCKKKMRKKYSSLFSYLWNDGNEKKKKICYSLLEFIRYSC